MKPRWFEFHNPGSVEEALALAKEHEDDFMYYAGGTEAVIGLKERVLAAGHLINLKKIPGLDAILLDDGILRIGALVTHQRLADSPVVRQVLPGYAALSENVANIRVRSAGTLAGNLCFAEPNADPPALLAALDATLALAGPDGVRTVSVRDFFDGPYSTVREEIEILTEIAIPVGEGNLRSAYRKVVYLNRPSAGVAAVRRCSGDKPTWEIWAGSITGQPERLDAVCELLNEIDSVDEDRIVGAARRDMETRSILEGLHGSEDYRKHLVTVLAVRSVRGVLND